jgi:hypothetical protein
VAFAPAIIAGRPALAADAGVDPDTVSTVVACERPFGEEPSRFIAEPFSGRVAADGAPAIDGALVLDGAFAIGGAFATGGAFAVGGAFELAEVESAIVPTRAPGNAGAGPEDGDRLAIIQTRAAAAPAAAIPAPPSIHPENRCPPRRK